MELQKTTDYFNKSIEDLKQVNGNNIFTEEERLLSHAGEDVQYYSNVEEQGIEKIKEKINAYVEEENLKVKAILEMTNGLVACIFNKG